MKAQTTAAFAKVLYYLDSDAKYRDDDELLVARYWYDELISFGVDMNKPVLPKEVLKFFVSGKPRLTNYDTITRLRRKAQEQFPNLRGKTYAERKHHKTERAKGELGELEKLFGIWKNQPVER